MLETERIVMKTKISFGVAVAAVFFLHPVALCAAGAQVESSHGHACCPKETAPDQKSPEAPCCKISSLPASQGSAERTGTPVLSELPATTEIWVDTSFEEVTP